MTRLLFDERRAREWLETTAIFREVVYYMMELWPVDRLYVVTMFRSKFEEQEIEEATGRKPSGVHQKRPHCACDIRIWNLGRPGLSMQSRAERIAKAIDDTFDYDPDRPGQFPVAYARPHGTGPHIHLQTHLNTVRRTK